MPRGTVKDPAGHQSKEHDFGYIQREEGPPWSEDEGPYKAIPFKNRDKNQDRIYTKPKEIAKFKSRTAEVVYKGKVMGTIGIAVLKEQLAEFDEEWDED